MDASFRVRRRFPSVDARITAGDLDRMEVAAVVAGMVKRAMLAGDGAVTSQQEIAGPFQRNVQYANPMGNLYFTADDVATLSEGGSSRRAFSVDLTPPPAVYYYPL
jgi:arginine deiminase